RDGQYDIAGIPEGTYLVETVALGFSTDTRQGVRIGADQGLTLDIALKVAAVSEQVTVTAAGSPQARDQVAKSLDVVSSDEATARQNTEVPEALTTVAGLRIQRQGGPGSLTTIRFRGLRSQDTSVLIDDVRVRDASDLYGSLGTFYEDLLMTGVQRVEIVRGAGSTLYGSNAVGGVINLIPVQGAGAPHFTGLLEGGSLGTFHGQFAGSGGTDTLGYSFGVDQLNVANGVDGDDEYRATSLAGRVSYRLTDRMQLSGNLLFNDSRLNLNGNPYFRGVNGGSLFPPAPVVFADAPNDPDDVRDGRLFLGSVRLEHTVNSFWSYSVGYSGNTTRRELTSGPASDPAFYAEVAPFTFDYDGDGQPDVSGLGNLEFEGTVQTFDGRTRFLLGSHNVLTAGYEAERETYFQYFPGPFGSSRQAFNGFGFDFDFDGINDASRDKQWTYAVYGNDQISLVDGRLQIGLGARWQGFHVSDTEALFGTANLVRPDNARIQSIPASLQGINEKSAVTGDGSIAYTFPTAGTRIWAHLGSSFRAPSLYERFSNVSDSSLVASGLVRVGDPTLSPELSLTVDGGIEQTAFNDTTRFGATYF
ncbi:MAG TPA: TonB-dependent receptor plug domain-containing protein, partial [Blastocatellia bacterium]|nr:TonB-dependent receptor plug domain-containing protein [Blastocatellia bacterium]